MQTNHPNEPPLYILVLGQGDSVKSLAEQLRHLPSVAHVSEECGGHHAFGEIRSGRVNTIFIDPFSMWGDTQDATFTIFHVRMEFPEIVFVLFVDPSEMEAKKSKLFDNNDEWFRHLSNRERRSFAEEGTRLSHYLRLGKDIDSSDFSKRLGEATLRCQQWHQSIRNKRPLAQLFVYDVALSFAGEDRRHAEEIAEVLKAHGVRVFYDSFEQANLWGKDLFTHLHAVYSKKSRYCMVFVSKDYASKMWTVHERRSAQERVLKERDNEYLLPVRIDDTELPGFPSTIAYVGIRHGGLEICRLFIQKLGGVLGTLL